MARSKFSAPLKSVFLAGKGVSYTSSRTNESSPVTDRLNLIPTFGEPTSDMLLAAEGNSSIPLTPIGRIAAVNGNELAIYLEKIKQYEQQFTPAAGIEASAWKKNVIHMVGANDQYLKDLLYGYLNAHKAFIKDTFYGAEVSDFVKSSSAGGEQSAADRIKILLNGGVNLLTYFGHSSAQTLGFNMEDPVNYSNQGKYPVFHMMGCNVGNIFIWDANRLSTISTISDKYVFAKERGSIGMMAGTSFGYVYPLQQYNGALYKLMANEGYRLTLGELMQKAIINSFAIAGGETDLFVRAQAEEYLLHGDPAVKLYQFEKPDYAVEDELVSIDPGFVSVAENDFKVNVKMMNLGKAISRKLIVQLTRTFPDLTTQVIQRDTIEGIRYADSITYTVSIDPIKDKGLNKITVTIDPENNIDELFKSNNSVVKEVYIFEDELRPVYPYNYAIVNKASITFKASTANALAATKNYMIEVDTTTLFNSSLKVTQTKTSPGGIVEFNPVVNFKDSVVYYWRVASAPAQNEEPRWNTASFVYINGDETGFNQSNYYQMLNNTYDNINLDAARSYNFNEFNSTINITSTIHRSGIGASQTQLTVGDVVSQRGMSKASYWRNSLRFYVINNKTMKPVANIDLGSSGLYGSYRPLPWEGFATNNYAFFTFDISTTAARQTVMKFLDSIPSDFYFAVTNGGTMTAFPETWQGDTATLGTNNSLYHKLKQMGFSYLDSVKSVVPFVFIGEKGSSTALSQSVANSLAETINLNATVKTHGNSGYITSPILGPATKWNHLRWDGKKLETPDGDNPTLDIIGIKTDGSQTTVLSNIQPSVGNIDVSGIDAKLYPSLILRMRNVDSTNYTPYQLKYWRLFYTPAPEGAIAPNTFFQFKDTLDAGEPLDVGIAFKNISENAFDSVKVKLTIRDKNNRETTLAVSRQKPIIANDTIRLQIPVSTVSFTGTNQLYLEFNPDKDQPEQYNFNNFLYKNFYVRADSLNPFMDVTFDGLHILNRDIVSSKPDILIKLTDEAKYLLLNNSDLIKVQLRHPNGSVRDYQFNSDTLILTPPGQGGNDENTAAVKFKPHLLEDGEYELIVSGKDQSGNTAGSIDYRIAFQVINKPMISNLLNYPNPFTTSTAFVFTLTGSDVPQNIRIQILTITGKIVREITKSELGPLRIGRNITEFKWDGTDQYGQKLANGVYLYRVLTNLNGKSLDKYKAADDNTDKYFNKGYGKMVLIR
ncbi:C25 family cysteine peptidase [Niabella ginsengisoli]|uniref:C25 family cysteine peptidase n=1 Tax=Niabella ginsengisoli TaxID=522298 RepID=A0ABS9SQU5_9BACT|nr:C25 family cysteine peptidase [Niabella ginsengisoli]MCH5600626.1 C25 family cysteine peptidase [Niabella ginsengisoli]